MTASRNYSVDEVKQAQALIHQCLKSYLSRDETAERLSDRYDNGFVGVVWHKLEQQNPEFFKSYNVRIKIKDQINSFNDLVNEQAQVMKHEGVLVQNNASPSTPVITAALANRMSFSQQPSPSPTLFESRRSGSTIPTTSTNNNNNPTSPITNLSAMTNMSMQPMMKQKVENRSSDPQHLLNKLIQEKTKSTTSNTPNNTDSRHTPTQQELQLQQILNDVSSHGTANVIGGANQNISSNHTRPTLDVDSDSEYMQQQQIMMQIKQMQNAPNANATVNAASNNGGNQNLFNFQSSGLPIHNFNAPPQSNHSNSNQFSSLLQGFSVLPMNTLGAPTQNNQSEQSNSDRALEDFNFESEYDVEREFDTELDRMFSFGGK
ncbi:hypothetical protein AKO1_008185 [Acrasis kona]|uniref:Uncharacterized protein n=1 Tax=Acrasis kona TaxID=1008807 RepID=A0AAW2YM87_9EUKA